MIISSIDKQDALAREMGFNEAELTGAVLTDYYSDDILELEFPYPTQISTSILAGSSSVLGDCIPRSAIELFAGRTVDQTLYPLHDPTSFYLPHQDLYKSGSADNGLWITMVGSYRENLIKVHSSLKNIPLESALRMGELPELALKNPVHFGNIERDRLLNQLRTSKSLSKNDIKIIESAINLAHDEHKGQIRKATKYPYEIHPNGMTRFLLGLQLTDVDLFTATPIHDVVEDATLGIPDVDQMSITLRHSFGYSRLAQKFPKRVAWVVMELTKTDTRFDTTGIPIKLLLEEQQRSIAHLMEKGSIRSVIIKLIDRLYNLTDIHNIPLSSLYNQTLETMQFMIPAIEERLQRGPTKAEEQENGHKLSLEFYTAAGELLQLLKWQTLVASVGYYRMCKVVGYEPVSLAVPFDKDWYALIKVIKTVNPYGDIGYNPEKPKKRYRL